MLNLRSAAPSVAPPTESNLCYSSPSRSSSQTSDAESAAAAETQAFHNEAQKCSTATTTENTSRRQTEEGFSPRRQTVYTGGRPTFRNAT